MNSVGNMECESILTYYYPPIFKEYITDNHRLRFDGMYETQLTLFYHPTFIFIYRNTFPQNTKTDDGEINISESILYHFAKVKEFLVIH